jgi:hypothetical protein
MESKFVGPWHAIQTTGKGLSSLYRLALEGKIRHRLSPDGRVELHRDDLVNLKPAYSREPKHRRPGGGDA